MTMLTPATQAEPIPAPGTAAPRAPVAESGLDFTTHTDLTMATVYGPVPSRRYGTTLGLNLSPAGEKYCPLRCTYCQLGPEKRRAPPVFPELATLAAELAETLQRVAAGSHRLHALVLSGNGEATLHPQFAQAIDVILRGRDAWAPGVPTVLLTCATELRHPEVRAAVARLDEVAIKLDAGTQSTYDRLEMPWQPTPVRSIAESAGLLPNAILQTMLVTGSVDNTTPAEVDAWLDLVRVARPRRVDLYTLDRPPVEKKLRKASPEVMAAIAARVVAEAGVPCRVFAHGLDD